MKPPILSVTCHQGATVTWSSSNGNLTLASGQGSASATFINSGNGSCDINASAIVGNDTVALQSYKVWTGKPIINYISGDQHVEKAGLKTKYSAITQENPETTYQWRVVSSSGQIISSSGKSAIILFPEDGDYRVEVDAINSCGTSTSELFVAVGTYEPYSLFPNPASETVTLSLTGEAAENNAVKTTSSFFSTYEVQLWSEQSGLIKTLHSDQPTLQIPLNGLSKGQYFVHVIIDGKTYKRQLWVK